MAILTAPDVFGFASPAEQEAWIRQKAAGLRAGGYANEPASIQPVTAVAPARAAVRVRVNHARWIVDCPNGDGGALLAAPGHPMMCPYCCNADIGGQWRPVVWPRDRALIEAALDARLFVHNRNWRDEPVTELLAENGAHPESVRRAA